jgi:hypothetical protein
MRLMLYLEKLILCLLWLNFTLIRIEGKEEIYLID